MGTITSVVYGLRISIFLCCNLGHKKQRRFFLIYWKLFFPSISLKFQGNIPLYPKLRSVDSLLSVINYTLSINFTIEKRTQFFNSAGFFWQNSNSLEILQQAAQLKMELIWKNLICEVIQDLRCLKFCDNLAKTIGKLWL